MTTRRSTRLAKNVAATNEDVNARLATDVSTLKRLHDVHNKLQNEEYFNRCVASVAKGGSTNNVLREILKYNKWRASGRKTDRGILVKNLKYIYDTNQYKNATEKNVKQFSVAQLIGFARCRNSEFMLENFVEIKDAFAEELIGEHFTRHNQEEDSEEGDDESEETEAELERKDDNFSGDIDDQGGEFQLPTSPEENRVGKNSTPDKSPAGSGGSPVNSDYDEQKEGEGNQQNPSQLHDTSPVVNRVGKDPTPTNTPAGSGGSPDGRRGAARDASPATKPSPMGVVRNLFPFSSVRRKKSTPSRVQITEAALTGSGSTNVDANIPRGTADTAAIHALLVDCVVTQKETSLEHSGYIKNLERNTNVAVNKLLEMNERQDDMEERQDVMEKRQDDTEKTVSKLEKQVSKMRKSLGLRNIKMNMRGRFSWGSVSVESNDDNQAEGAASPVAAAASPNASENNSNASDSSASIESHNGDLVNVVSNEDDANSRGSVEGGAKEDGGENQFDVVSACEELLTIQSGELTPDKAYEITHTIVSVLKVPSITDGQCLVALGTLNHLLSFARNNNEACAQLVYDTFGGDGDGEDLYHFLVNVQVQQKKYSDKVCDLAKLIAREYFVDKGGDDVADSTITAPDATKQHTAGDEDATKSKDGVEDDVADSTFPQSITASDAQDGGEKVYEVQARLIKFEDNAWKKEPRGLLSLYRNKTTDKKKMVLRSESGNRVMFNVAISNRMTFEIVAEKTEKGKDIWYVQFVAVENAGEEPKPIRLNVAKDNIDEFHEELTKLAA